MRIGILGSEGHDTLIPTECGDFILRVVRVPEVETYVAGYALKSRPKDFIYIAAHPNGHSCKALLRRIGSKEDALAQFDYILRCGGMGIERESFKELLTKF